MTRVTVDEQLGVCISSVEYAHRCGCLQVAYNMQGVLQMSLGRSVHLLLELINCESDVWPCCALKIIQHAYDFSK